MTHTTREWYEFMAAVAQRDLERASRLLSANPELIHLRNGIGETVLHYQAVENDIEGVRWLHDHGADLNTRNEFGKPVIFEVAQLGYEELFRWFVASGADTRQTDANGGTIQDHLSEYDKPQMAKMVDDIIAEQRRGG